MLCTSKFEYIDFSFSMALELSIYLTKLLFILNYQLQIYKKWLKNRSSQEQINNALHSSIIE